MHLRFDICDPLGSLYFCFAAGLRQHCTDIIRLSHGASSGRKVYRSSFIPGLHDVCMIFENTPSKGV